MHFTRVFIALRNLSSERESEAQGLILCRARPFGAEYSRACPGISQPALQAMLARVTSGP
jgi:hypothetical protein